MEAIICCLRTGTGSWISQIWSGKNKNIMNISKSIIYISADQMRSEFARILKTLGLTDEGAEKCADIFTLNSLEGVYSHGVNRFPRFVRNIKEGFVIPSATPSIVNVSGSLEQWNGNLGPGPLNALFAAERAMTIASSDGLGLVAMANTNHWMRGGTYGWHAAKKGFVFISWTNTCPNMPAWGAVDPRLGNNPFVLAVPYRDEAVVLDFAMSQFSYGKMESFRNQGKKLPSPGGYDTKGELTDNPDEILETWRPLPAGYWKGASLSLMLDILATILSGGQSVHDINSCTSEYAVSQVFIAIDIKKLQNYPVIQPAIDSIIHDLYHSVPENKKTIIRYPGENIKKIREKSLSEGIPVDKKIWEEILSF
jgi:3-dehydro-L-gulonate 2-dehydrogenase